MTVLLVASGGGHLKQLHMLHARIRPEEDKIWAVPRNALSESLLHDQCVVWLHYNGPRDLLGVLRNALLLIKRLRAIPISAVVTTGANHGLAAWPVAVLKGARFTFIDSASRVVKPSLSGRVARWLPKAQLLAQYPRPTHSGRWQFVGSVFDAYSSRSRAVERGRKLRIFVTVGAMEDVGFPRMVQQVESAAPNNAEIVWQLGPTSPSPRRGKVHDFMPAAQQEELIREADVVISHAGVGSILAILTQGKVPVIMPRVARLGEHVDDHQLQIASLLSARGVVVSVLPEESLSIEHLQSALELHSLYRPGEATRLPI